MNILYFHQHFTTPTGSGGTRSYEMAKFLAAKGHTVTVVCGSRDRANTGVGGRFHRGLRQGQVDGFRVMEIKLPYSNKQNFVQRSIVFAAFACRCIWIALYTKTDIVFATSTPLTAAIPGIAAGILKQKPFVFEVRDLWPELPRAMGVIRNPLVLAALGALELAAYRSSRACIGLSPGIVEGIRARSQNGKRIAMIPNGCDTDMFRPMRDIKRNIPGIGENQFVAAFTGAHGKANGLDAILDAAEIIRDRRIDNITLLFVGDGSEKKRLISRAREQKLSSCLFKDYVPKSDVPALLTMIDAGLQILMNVPAFYQGTSPNKFFDYLSSGLPVIINYPGWLAEMVQTNHCGITVVPENPGTFVDALVTLRDNPDLCVDMGRNARRLAENVFSRHTLASQFADVVESAAHL